MTTSHGSTTSTITFSMTKSHAKRFSCSEVKYHDPKMKVIALSHEIMTPNPINMTPKQKSRNKAKDWHLKTLRNASLSQSQGFAPKS